VRDSVDSSWCGGRSEPQVRATLIQPGLLLSDLESYITSFVKITCKGFNIHKKLNLPLDLCGNDHRIESWATQHFNFLYCTVQYKLTTKNITSISSSSSNSSSSDSSSSKVVVKLQAWSGPEGSRKLRFPDFMTTAQDGGKIVSLTHRPPLPPGNTPGTHFCYRLSRPQDHSAIGRILCQ